MMTEIKALFVVVVLFLLLLGGSVLNIDINAGDSSNDAWKSTVLEQSDGKKLSIKLPFVLDGYTKIDNVEGVKKEEKFYHQVDDITVAVDHGVIDDSNKEIDFSQDIFLMDYGDLDDKCCEKIEEKNIHGQNMTYAKLSAKKNSYPYTFECFGIHSGEDYWIITYIYNENNKTSKELVEKSIKSIEFH